MKLPVTRTFSFIFILGFMVSFNCQAAGVYRWGGGLNNGTFAVDDPAGKTSSENTSYISGILAMPISRNNQNTRWWFEGSYRELEYSAAPGKIGQQAKSLGINAIAQYAVNVSPLFRPWVGAGVGVGFNDFTGRYSVDSDGFLLETLSDRSETNIGLLLNIGLSTRKTDAGFYFGANIIHQITIDNGIGGTQLQLFVLF